MRTRHQWLALSVLCVGLVTAGADAPARVKVSDLPRGFVPTPPVRDPDGRLLFVAGACCKPGDYRGIFGIIDGAGNVPVLRERDDPSVDLNLGLFGPDGNMYDAYGSGGLVRHALHGGVPDDAVTRIKTGTSKPVGSVALGYDGAI